MKKHILLFLMLLPVVTNADPIEIDGIWYELHSSNTASVLSNPSKYTGDIVIPNTIEYLDVSYVVNMIDGYAFYNCKDLTSVSIPESVYYIDWPAFDGCDALSTIYITNLEAWCFIFGDKSFHENANPNQFTYHLYLNGEEIHDLVIPDGVTSIGNNAFDGCIGLNSITLPNSIAYIGRYAFGDCSNVIIPCSSIPELEYWYTDYWTGEMYVDAFSTDCKIFVPASQLDVYKKDYRWGLLESQLFAIEGETEYNVTVHAQEHTSDISSVIGEEHLDHIISLKLSGTINGYDVQVIRDRMPLLHQLDLSNVTIVTNSYPYYTDKNGNSHHTENDVLGDYCFANMAELQDIQLPQNIKKIGNYAFSGCKTLRIIKLPKGIVSIGDYAFSGCNLKTIIVNDPEPAIIFESTFPNRANMTLSILEGCKDSYLSTDYWKDFRIIIDDSEIIHFADKKVEDICISLWDSDGDGNLSKIEAVDVQFIGDYVAVGAGAVLAFNSPFIETGITSFDELKYFTGLTKIEGWAFYDCKNLSSIIIPENVLSIGGSYSFYHLPMQEAGTFTWGGRVHLGAFNGCSSLSSISIPKGIRSIEEFAFEGCDNLKEVQISDMQSWMDINFGNWSANPLSYAHHLFLDNQEVTNIQIPEDMTSIKNYVFSGCEGLTSVSLPNSITSIGDGAFRGCINIPSISLPENLTSIGKYAFQNCSSISSLQIPKGITELSNGVFAGCTQLKSIDIPSTVRNIGGYFVLWDDIKGVGLKDATGVFEGCSSLTSVNISEGITSIGVNTFEWCI